MYKTSSNLTWLASYSIILLNSLQAMLSLKRFYTFIESKLLSCIKGVGAALPQMNWCSSAYDLWVLSVFMFVIHVTSLFIVVSTSRLYWQVSKVTGDLGTVGGYWWVVSCPHSLSFDLTPSLSFSLLVKGPDCLRCTVLSVHGVALSSMKRLIKF